MVIMITDCWLVSWRPRDAPTDDVCREDEQRAGEVDDDGQDRVAGRLAGGGSSQRQTQAGPSHLHQVSPLLSDTEQEETQAETETNLQTGKILSGQEQN